MLKFQIEMLYQVAPGSLLNAGLRGGCPFSHPPAEPKGAYENQKKR